MPALTVEITPDLESRLRREAAREGLDAQGYILSTLRERLAQARGSAAAGSTVPKVDAVEAALLRQINQGLPAETWRRYGKLKEKRRAETLLPAEQAELIAISDRVEEMNVQRMENVVKLAQRRHVPVDALMDELGIKGPLYE